MVDYVTLSVEATYAWARISTMTGQTRQVGHTITVHQTFWPTTAGIRVTNVWRYAHAFQNSIVFTETLSVVPTR